MRFGSCPQKLSQGLHGLSGALGGGGFEMGLAVALHLLWRAFLKFRSPASQEPT